MTLTNFSRIEAIRNEKGDRGYTAVMNKLINDWYLLAEEQLLTSKRLNSVIQKQNEDIELLKYENRQLKGEKVE